MIKKTLVKELKGGKAIFGQREVRNTNKKKMLILVQNNSEKCGQLYFFQSPIVYRLFSNRDPIVVQIFQLSLLPLYGTLFMQEY